MAVELKSTLNGAVKEVEVNKAYMVDFSTLNSVNDLVLIIQALGINFPYNHPLIEHLKPFLNFDNPIDIAPQPKKGPFIPLDKLDKIDESIEERIFNKETK
jgi:hypothetical protein